MLSLYRTLSLRYLCRRRFRAALVVACIGLGVATLVATHALNESMLAAARTAVTPLEGVADLHVSNGDFGVRRDLAPLVNGIPGVQAVAPLLFERGSLPELHNQSVLLVGFDRDTISQRGNPWGVEIHLADDIGLANLLSMLTGPVFAGKDLAARCAQELPGANPLHVKIGGKTHRLPHWTGTVEAHGPAAALGGSVLFLENAHLARLLGRPELVTRLDVTLEQGANREEVGIRIQEVLNGRALVRTPEVHDQSVQDVMAPLQVGFALCGTGALVIGLFLVYNVLAVSVAERRHEIGILRSAGATRGQVWRLFVGEAGILGLAGAALGVPAGWGLARLGLEPMREVVSGFFVALDAGRVALTPGTTLVSAAAGVVTAMVAALVPALRAAQEEPAEAVRRMPPRWHLGHRLAQLAASSLLVGGGLGAIALRAWLPARAGTYGGLALVLLGLLLTTPLVADAIARLFRPAARRFLGLAGRLAADNLVCSPARPGLVIAALAAGVAMVFQTTGVIRSNEDAILAWIDETTAADLFISSGSSVIGSGENQPLAAELGTAIAARPGVQAVVPVRFRMVDYGDKRVFLEALDAAGFHAADRKGAIVAGREMLPRLCAPGRTNVLISDNFAALYGVKDGDEIFLPGPRGRIPVHVAGTIVDYSWTRGTIIIDWHRYQEHFQDPLVDMFDVYLRPGADQAAVREDLARRWGAEQALVVLTRAELRRQIAQMIAKLYGIAYSQETVVAIVAALGVVIALLVSVLQRRHELGLLRAVGATRTQVLRSVLAEATLMGVIGTLIGLMVGVALEWYCVQVILFDEVGFRFPVCIPWREAILIAGLALLLATLAGLGPAIHTSRLRIPEAIAFE